jgi:surface antigen
MRKFATMLMILAIAPLFIGCSSTGGPKQTTGTLVGGAAGALIGSQFGSGSGRILGTAIGTLGGALVGGEVGKHLDDQDRRRY